MNLKKGYINISKIKLALATCSEPHCSLKCPYFDSSPCFSALSSDALNYIIRLEGRLDDYEKKQKDS